MVLIFSFTTDSQFLIISILLPDKYHSCLIFTSAAFFKGTRMINYFN